MTERTVLGIDLGTTYSCVAYVDETGRATTLQNSDGDLTTPSVVFYESPENVVVGSAAKNELEIIPDRVAQLVKRHMGEVEEDTREPVKIEVGGQFVLPQQVSGIVLRRLAEDALLALGREVPETGDIADVVITVPAYFGSTERQATRDAGRLAGLNVLDIINEPSAAAIAYGLTNSGSGQGKTVLVYDLGGGTFDVTIMRLDNDEIREVATGGDHRLGGADWDKEIRDLLAEEFMSSHADVDPRRDQDEAGTLTILAEDLKKDLSRREARTVSLTAGGNRVKIEMSRASVEQATQHLLGKTLDFTEEVLAAAATKGCTEIDELLMVGGMTRWPAVAAGLRDRFPHLPEPKSLDPDQIVAKGAALYAAAYEPHADMDDGASPQGGGFLPGGKKVPRIIHVTAKGYGVKLVRDEHDKVGYVENLIEPQAELPVAATRTFHTVSQNQTWVEVIVYESLTHVVSTEFEANKDMATAEITGLPPNQPAGIPVDMTWELGADGLLRLRATCQGRSVDIEVKVATATPEEVFEQPLPFITG